MLCLVGAQKTQMTAEKGLLYMSLFSPPLIKSKEKVLLLFA